MRYKRGEKRQRTLRWCVALASDEANLIFGAAQRAGVKSSVWGRQALLRVALLQWVAPEIEQAAEAGVPRPRVKRR